MNREDMAGDFKEYLGDGVYISWDGYQINLYTERESGRVEWIALDPATFEALTRYNERLLEWQRVQVEKMKPEPLP